MDKLVNEFKIFNLAPKKKAAKKGYKPKKKAFKKKNLDDIPKMFIKKPHKSKNNPLKKNSIFKRKGKVKVLNNDAALQEILRQMKWGFGKNLTSFGKIYISKNGKIYKIRKSKQTGNLYKYYY